jgi:hypothetical protein
MSLFCSMKLDYIVCCVYYFASPIICLPTAVFKYSLLVRSGVVSNEVTQQNKQYKVLYESEHMIQQSWRSKYCAHTGHNSTSKQEPDGVICHSSFVCR